MMATLGSVGCNVSPTPATSVPASATTSVSAAPAASYDNVPGINSLPTNTATANTSTSTQVAGLDGDVAVSGTSTGTTTSPGAAADSSASSATTTAVSATTQTGTSTAADQTSPAEPTTPEVPSGPAVSATGQKQLSDVVAYAKKNHKGASAGQCFNAVWGYLTSSGYGKLKSWGDLPNMKSGEARHFAEYLNGSQAHRDEAGLQRFDTAFNPPITNPHDARIPVGAVIVVAAGSTGTAHPTAGDIVIKAGSGHFINDGPNMDYGTKSGWQGKLLGVYIPR
jgi:hypothetical protein